MSKLRRHPVIATISGLVLIGLIAVLAFGLYLASATGSLPWQTDPTLIPVPTAFTNAGGFTIPTPLPTVTQTS